MHTAKAVLGFDLGGMDSILGVLCMLVCMTKYIPTFILFSNTIIWSLTCIVLP